MRKINDLSGQRFGNWTVISRDLINKRPVKYYCKCDCGKIHSIYYRNLVAGFSTKCMDCTSISHSKNLIGKKIHYITILSVEKINGKTKLKVKCDCGRYRHIPPRVSNGTYKSCGLCNLNKPKCKNVNRYLDVGNKLGSLTIIKKIDSQTSLAKCECGTEKEVKIYHMQSKHPSCGCYWRKLSNEKAKSLIGTKIGYLKVIDFLGMKGEKKRAHYLLKCKCGKKIEKKISYLWSSNSCGCLQKEMIPKGSEKHNSILQEFEVSSMRTLFKSGYYTKRELAKMFKISESNAGHIINNQTWTHVKD